MKSIKAFTAVAMKLTKSLTAAAFLLVLLSATQAWACPTITYQQLGGFNPWYDFEFDSGCMSSSTLTASNLSCGDGAYKFGTGYSQYAQWSFVVPSDGTTIANGTFYQLSTHYQVKLFIDFSSPDQTFYDNMVGTVTVTHNGSNTGTTIFALYGNTASTQTCAMESADFTATNGDTVTVRIDVTSWGTNANIKTGVPTVFNLYQ